MQSTWLQSAHSTLSLPVPALQVETFSISTHTNKLHACTQPAMCVIMHASWPRSCKWTFSP